MNEELLNRILSGIDGITTEVSELRTELKAEISELRTEFKSDMSELRTELKSGYVGAEN